MHTVEFIQDCLDRYAEGDENALHQLMVRANQRLYVLAHRALERIPSLKGEMTPEDITNDFYVTALEEYKEKSTSGLPRQAQHFLAWSAKLMRTSLVDALRKYVGREDEPHDTKVRRRGNSQSVQVAVSQGLDPVSSTYDPAEVDKYTDVHRRIAELPEKQRLALDLRYFYDYDNAVAAEMAGVSPRTMSLWYNQALASLGVASRSSKPPKQTD